MKIFAVGKGGAFFKMGNSFETAAWFATEKVADAAKMLQKLDEVEAQYEQKGKNLFLTDIKLVRRPEPKPGTPATGSGPTAYTEKPAFKPYERSPETQELIRRQAVGNMASRALIALQGQVDPNNVCEVIDTLYKKFDELTSK